jgi:hypothetical protein
MPIDPAAGSHGPTSARESVAPPSARLSFVPSPPPKLKTRLASSAGELVAQLGQVGRMTGQAIAAAFKRPFELQATLHQMESLGVS